MKTKYESSTGWVIKAYKYKKQHFIHDVNGDESKTAKS